MYPMELYILKFIGWETTALPYSKMEAQLFWLFHFLVSAREALSDWLQHGAAKWRFGAVTNRLWAEVDLAVEAGAELCCPWGAEGSVQVSGSGQVSGWFCRSEWVLRKRAEARDGGARWACLRGGIRGNRWPRSRLKVDSSAPRLLADDRFLTS